MVLLFENVPNQLGLKFAWEQLVKSCLRIERVRALGFKFRRQSGTTRIALLDCNGNSLANHPPIIKHPCSSKSLQRSFDHFRRKPLSCEIVSDLASKFV
jgi:Leucine-rich repeat (LRR) protein